MFVFGLIVGVVAGTFVPASLKEKAVDLVKALVAKLKKKK